MQVAFLKSPPDLTTQFFVTRGLCYAAPVAAIFGRSIMINSFQERLFYRVVGMLGLLALVVTALPQAVASQITCEYKVDIASSERLVNALDVYGLDSEGLVNNR